jgi:hypothetical protein
MWIRPSSPSSCTTPVMSPQSESMAVGMRTLVMCIHGSLGPSCWSLDRSGRPHSVVLSDEHAGASVRLAPAAPQDAHDDCVQVSVVDMVALSDERPASGQSAATALGGSLLMACVICRSWRSSFFSRSAGFSSQSRLDRGIWDLELGVLWATVGIDTS